MSVLWSCPRGHQWESLLAPGPVACPVCGATAAPGSAHGLEDTRLGTVALSEPPQGQATTVDSALAGQPSAGPCHDGATFPTLQEGGTKELPVVPGFDILRELGRGGMGVV